jgi:AraC-like DNA-binding protein
MTEASELEDAALAGDRISIKAYFELWDALVLLAPNPERISLEVGTHFDPDHYGPLGLAFKTAPHLRAAIDLAVRYLHALTDAARLTIEESATTLELCLHRDIAGTYGLLTANEATLIEIVHAMRSISGQPIGLSSVTLKASNQAPMKALEDFFGCPVLPNSRDDALLFDAATLSGTLPKSDEGLASFLVEHLKQTVPEHPELAWLHQVRETIANVLPQSQSPLETVARSMGMSSRTLQRRLAEQDKTFKDLLDGVRKDLAMKVIGSTSMPIAEVAFLIGFADAAALVRAFKRWTGSTPSAFRRS